MDDYDLFDGIQQGGNDEFEAFQGGLQDNFGPPDSPKRDVMVKDPEQEEIAERVREKEKKRMEQLQTQQKEELEAK